MTGSTSFESLGIDFQTNAEQIGVILDQFGNRISSVNVKIDKLTDSSDQLNKIKADGLIAQANSAQKLIDKLNELVATYSFSKEQIYAYQAAQLGITAQTENQIAELTRLKKATEEFQITQKRDLELYEMRSKASAQATLDYIKFWETALAEADKAAVQQVIIEQKRDLELYEMRSKSATDQIAIEQKRDLELNQMRAKAEAEQMARLQESAAATLAAYESEKSAAISLAAFKNRTLAENRAAAIKLLDEQEAAATKAAEEQAIAEIKWSNLSYKTRLQQLETLRAYQTNSAISPGTIASTFNNIPLSAQQNSTAEISKYAAELQKVQTVAHGAAEATNAFGIQTARATSEVVVMAREFSRGNYSRMAGSFTILASAFGAVLNPITLLALATAGLTYVVIKGSFELDNFNRQMQLTGNMAAITRDNLDAMSIALSNDVTGGANKARGVLEGLAATGKFTHDSLAAISQAVLEFMHLSGENADKAISMFAAMSEGVAQWAAKQNESYHFLTLAQYEHIKLLEEQGLKQEAMTGAAKIFTDSVNQHIEKVGSLVEWYREWGITIDKVVNGLKNIGRGPSDNTKLDTMLNTALRLQDTITSLSTIPKDQRTEAQNDVLASYQAEYAKMETAINKLIDDSNKERFRLNREAASKEIQAQGIEADERRATLQRQIRTPDQKRKDAHADIESEEVRRNASVLDEQLKDRGIYYSEIIQQAKEADAKEVAEAKLSGEYRVNAQAHEFEAQLQLQKQYGLKLATNAGQLAAMQQAATEKFHDHRGPDDGQMQLLEKHILETKTVFDKEDEIYKSRLDTLNHYHQNETISNQDYYQGLKASRNEELEALAANYNTQMTLLLDFNARTDKERAEILVKIAKTTEDYKKHVEEINNLKIKDSIDQASPVKFTQETNKILLSAREVKESADAIDKYNTAAKQSALELARLQITKAQLDPVTQSELINNRLAAASLEDLAIAYSKMGKAYQQTLALEEARTSVVSANVIGAEQAKVVAAKIAHDKQIEYLFDIAKAGINASRSQPGGSTAEQEAAYAKVVQLHDKLKALTGQDYTFNLKVAGLEDISNQFSSMAKSASTLGDNFAGATKGLQGFSDVFKKLAEIEEEERITGKKDTAARIGAYGDMADAASAFFDKGSQGYKTLQGVAEVFHAAQLAMNLVQMAQLAIKAVMTQAQGDPYSAWIRMAAMAAAMAALGFAVSGGFNSGSAGPSAADVQKTQGTGTVLGDAAAKSSSITDSMKLLANNSNIALTYTSQMLSALNSIDAAMSGLASIVARSSGISTGNNLGVFEGTLAVNQGDPVLNALGANSGSHSGGIDALGDSVLKHLDLSTAPGWLGNLFTKLEGLWGKTTQSITDSGLSISGSVKELISGKGFGQYADVTQTKSSFFGLIKDSSSNTIRGPVDQQISDQFGLVFKGLEDSLTAAAGALGKDSGSVKSAVDSINVNFSNLSLRGLTGQALTDAINNVISSVFDSASQNVLGGMQDFQKVGEGYYETVLRVASGVEVAKSALEKLGVTAINFSDIANKQGDVATEIIRDSILNKETVGYDVQHVAAQTSTRTISNPSYAGANGAGYGSGILHQFIQNATQTITETIPAYDIYTKKLSGVGEIMKDVSGTADDLIKTYTHLISIQTQMKDVGSNGNGLTISTIQGAGSLDALSSGLQSYFDNFFNDAEKATAKTDDLRQQFAKLGLAMPTGTTGFRALVNSIDLSTNAGQKLYGQVLLLADSFAALSKASETAAADAVSNAQDALKNSYDTQSQAIKTTIDGLNNFSKSITAFRDSLLTGSLSTLTPLEKYQAARQTAYNTVTQANAAVDPTNAAAVAAKTNAQSQEQGAITAFLESSKTFNASSETYKADFAWAQQALGASITAADNQADVAQQQLTQLTASVNGLITLNNSVLTVAQAIANLRAALLNQTNVTGTNNLSLSLPQAPDNINPQINGSHLDGLWRVPKDGYIAELHQGERVLTASQAEYMDNNAPIDYSRYSRTDNGPLIAEIKSLRQEVKALRDDQADQTNTLIRTNYDAHARTAKKVSDGNKEAAETITWANRSMPKYS